MGALAQGLFGRVAAAVVVAAVGFAGCRRASSSAGSDAGAAEPGSPLAFLEDDYPRALAEARARGVPVFVDAWAPWCHTCLSVRAYVFSDPALRPFARRFVWLAVDTEREGNAAFVTRFGIKVLPTLLVLDPDTEAVRMSHPGSLTAEELAPLLESVAPKDAGTLQATAADRLERLHAGGRAPECVRDGADEARAMPPGTARADVLRSALECARDLPPGAPERARVDDLLAVGTKAVADPAEPILADDRSDLYDYLVDALHDAHRDAEASELARSWVALLDAQATRAPTPAARAVFDAHRLLAYTAIGEPARAIPMLEQSARDFPDDYNPPARLGKALFDLKRYPEAIAALERALALAYGPRKLRFWSLEADAYAAQGDAAAERAALQRALEFAGTVPLTASYPQLRDAMARRLAALAPLP